MLWSGGMDGMEWIAVTPSTGEPVPPSPVSIVIDGPDVVSLQKDIIGDTSGLPDSANARPSQPPRPSEPPEVSAKAAAAAAKKKREEDVLRKYQSGKGLSNGDMNEMLKMVKAGRIPPNGLMRRVMHAVVLGCAGDDPVATIEVPRMIAPRNGATVHTTVKVAVLPDSNGGSSTSTHNRKTALLSKIMEELFEEDTGKIAALKVLADAVGVTVVDRRQQLSLTETLACRRFARVSGNQLYRFGTFLRNRGVVPSLLPRSEKVTRFEVERAHEVRVEKLRLITSNGEKDPSSKESIVWCLKRPAGILEDLTCASLLSQTFQDSTDISNFTRSLLVFMGADKAGDEITNIIRIGNRENGNHGTCCQPFARTEDGASENLFNCNKFFYSPRYPMKAFQQNLLDDTLHVVVVEL